MPSADPDGLPAGNLTAAQRGRVRRSCDIVAPAIIEAAAPLHLGVAETPEDREAVFRLRYETVVALGWKRAEELPEGIERDEHDDRSTQLAAWDGHKLVGSCRIVFPTRGRRLPVEEAFDLDLDDRAHVVELGRSIVSPEYRGDHRAFMALIAFCWIEMRKRGFYRAVAASPRGMVDLTTGLGLGIGADVLGPPRQHWGEERYPVLYDLLEAPQAPAIRERKHGYTSAS